MSGRRWTDDPALRPEQERVMVELSAELHGLRMGVGWSINQAARAAGVAESTVLDIEKTRGDPQVSTLLRLFYAYGRQLTITGHPHRCASCSSRVNRPHG